jgi:hypothetical protein
MGRLREESRKKLDSWFTVNMVVVVPLLTSEDMVTDLRISSLCCFKERVWKKRVGRLLLARWKRIAGLGIIDSQGIIVDGRFKFVIPSSGTKRILHGNSIREVFQKNNFLSVAGCRLQAIGCRLSVAGCRLSVAGCRLLVY